MKGNNNQNKNDKFKNLKTKGIAAILSATTFLGGLGIGVGLNQAYNNAKANNAPSTPKTPPTESAELIASEAENEKLKETVAILEDQVNTLKKYVQKLEITNAGQVKELLDLMNKLESVQQTLDIAEADSAAWHEIAMEYVLVVQELSEKVAEHTAKIFEQLKTIEQLEAENIALEKSLVDQEQKFEEERTITIEGLAQEFQRAIAENENGNVALADTLIKITTNKAQIGCLDGSLNHDKAIELLEAVKTTIEPHYYETEYDFYLADVINSTQCNIFFNHLIANSAKVGQDKFGLSATYKSDTPYGSYDEQGQIAVFGDERVSHIGERDDHAFVFSDGVVAEGAIDGEYRAEDVPAPGSDISSQLQNRVEIDLPSYVGESFEWFLAGDSEITPLGNGAYQIHAVVPEDGNIIYITSTITPSENGGYICNMDAKQGDDYTANLTLHWGALSQKDFDQIKDAIRAEINKAKTQASSLGE